MHLSNIVISFVGVSTRTRKNSQTMKRVVIMELSEVSPKL